MKIADVFSINIAIIGNVGAGKSTTLNAIFRNKYSEVSMKRATAGVNNFRMMSTARKGRMMKEHCNNKDSTAWAMVGNSGEARSAESTLKEITNDNAYLRNCDSSEVQEKAFDIELPEELCWMRDDTKVTVVDIPGLNEAGASHKYKQWVSDNWQRFDVVIVVMDGRQGVNTEEQVGLIKFVKENIEIKKALPLFFLCNKVDNPHDEQQAELVKESREEVQRVFGVDDLEQGLADILDKARSGQPRREAVTSPIFIPISGINAFIFQCCSSLTLEQFKEFNWTLIDKLGRDRLGARAWNRMNREEKYSATFEVVSDEEQRREGLEDSQFDIFLLILAYIIGGNDAQVEMIEKQIDYELSCLSPHNNFAQRLRTIQRKISALGTASTVSISDTFWNLYGTCEDDAFDAFKLPTDVTSLRAPVDALMDFQDFARQNDWMIEVEKAVARMKSLTLRQLGVLVTKVFETNVEDWMPTSRDQVEAPDWNQLSPFDWDRLLASILLLSYDPNFCRNFGKEKMILEQAQHHIGSCFDPKGLPYRPDDNHSCPTCSSELDFNRFCSKCVKYVVPGREAEPDSSKEVACPRTAVCGGSLDDNYACAKCKASFIFSEKILPDKRIIHCPTCDGKLDNNRWCAGCDAYYLEPGSTERTLCEDLRSFKFLPSGRSAIQMMYSRAKNGGEIYPANAEAYKSYVHVEVPAAISNPAHFGYVAWNYCELMASLKKTGV